MKIIKESRSIDTSSPESDAIIKYLESRSILKNDPVTGEYVSEVIIMSSDPLHAMAVKAVSGCLSSFAIRNHFGSSKLGIDWSGWVRFFCIKTDEEARKEVVLARQRRIEAIMNPKTFTTVYGDQIVSCDGTETADSKKYVSLEDFNKLKDYAQGRRV